jgi:hypothetical protein
LVVVSGSRVVVGLLQRAVERLVGLDGASQLDAIVRGRVVARDDEDQAAAIFQRTSCRS